MTDSLLDGIALPAADRLCALCRARLDAVAWSIGRHPGCGPYTALGDTAYERLAEILDSTERAAS